MKKIILVRHGKSAWNNPFLQDHDRPLAERGLRDAPKMAMRLKNRDVKPDLFLTSTANRAMKTAEITAEVLDLPVKIIHSEPQLYHASPEIILKIIRNQNDKYKTILVFGHNPGFNYFIELMGEDINNLPTSGQFGFTFKTEKWENISPQNASFWFFDFPKKST